MPRGAQNRAQAGPLRARPLRPGALATIKTPARRIVRGAHMTIGKAPAAWADKVWDRAANPPFKQEWKKRPGSFVKPYKAKSDISLVSLEGMEEEEIGDLLLSWL